MQIVNETKLYRAVAAVTVGMLCANSARAVVPEYTILDLSTLGGPTSEANGINNSGQVIGTSLTSTGDTRAFLTAPNSIINPAANMLPLLSGGALNKAYGVNATGQVAGWGTSSAGDRAYRYSAGASTALGPIKGNYSYGQSINPSGVVVGSSSNANGTNPSFHATLWSGTSPVDLGATASGDNSYAYGINSSGAVVGYSADEDPNSFARSDAFLWTSASGMVALTNTLGGHYAYARAINDAGQIVGEASDATDGPTHAFLRSLAGTMTDLGTLGGTSSQALSINATGLVVGNSRVDASTRHAFVWGDGAIHDLNDLIPATSDWTLTTATGINDGDQIVGSGTINGTTHAFLLTPLPTWAVNNDGTWSGAVDWIGGIPNGPSAEVRFTGAITTAHTVTLDTPRTVGHLVFDNPNRYTLAGATLTIDGAAATTGIEVRSGEHTIGAPVSFTSAATISLAASSSLKLSGAVSGSVKSLQLGSGAMLDLTSNNLVIDYDPVSGSPMASIAAALTTGSNGGAWNGPGIESSAAAAIAAEPSNPHKTALGYVDTVTLDTTTVASSFGQRVDASSILIGYTLQGDANLDGKVNALDLNALASGFGAPSVHWYQGDFNYDGRIDTLDFTALASNFGASPVPAPALGSAVPEPSLLLLALSCLLPTRRRRR